MPPALNHLLVKCKLLLNLPVDDFAASTETLAIDANEDRDALAAAGLDVTLIDELTPLSGALRYCQANWMSIFWAREEAQNQWKEQSPLAFEFPKNNKTLKQQ
jgi:hypothetical protein